MLPWRRRSRVPDVLVSLTQGPSGRADLARRGAITSQAGSHKDGSGTGSGPLLAMTAGQAAHDGLCRPPALLPRSCPSSRHLALVGASDPTCQPPATGKGSLALSDGDAPSTQPCQPSGRRRRMRRLPRAAWIMMLVVMVLEHHAFLRGLATCYSISTRSPVEG